MWYKVKTLLTRDNIIKCYWEPSIGTCQSSLANCVLFPDISALITHWDEHEYTWDYVIQWNRQHREMYCLYNCTTGVSVYPWKVGKLNCTLGILNMELSVFRNGLTKVRLPWFRVISEIFTAQLAKSQFLFWNFKYFFTIFWKTYALSAKILIGEYLSQNWNRDYNFRRI